MVKVIFKIQLVWTNPLNENMRQFRVAREIKNTLRGDDIGRIDCSLP